MRAKPTPAVPGMGFGDDEVKRVWFVGYGKFNGIREMRRYGKKKEGKDLHSLKISS